MSELNARIGERVRELRKQLSLTQEELAERAGISVSFLSMIERAERMPHLETLVRLTSALGVSLYDIFAAVSDPSKDYGKPLVPLIEYLQELSLEPSDVQALLVIAKALFEKTS